MEAAKFTVTPETKQIEFEAALLAHEDEMCADYERRMALAKEQEAKEKKDGDKSANGGKGDPEDDHDRRSRDRRGRSRSYSRSRSRSRSYSRGRGGGSRRRREKAEKAAMEAPPKRGFQEILDKRAVNLGIVFDALVEKAVVKRKEEVGCREVTS